MFSVLNYWFCWKRINTQFYSANKQKKKKKKNKCCYSSAPIPFVIPELCKTDDTKQYLNHVRMPISTQ